MKKNCIDEAFKKMIIQRGIHAKLGVKSGLVRTYRYNLSKGINVSSDKKLSLLIKSGWRADDLQFSRRDLVSLLNFWKRTSQQARELGPEYVIEKWEMANNI